MTPSTMEQARKWADDGLRLALATVVETWGSSPCPAGSQMVINSQGGFAGSVSGGCIETSVISESLEVLAGGGFTVQNYGVSDETAAAAGLACGGNIEVMMEPLVGSLLDALGGSRPAVRVIELESGRSSFLRNGVAKGELAIGEEIRGVAVEVETEELARTAEVEGRQMFFQPLISPYRMVVIGAVRIAQSLAAMAAEVGFDVTVIDPRPAFATVERFPGVNLLREWPDKALPKLGLDSHTAVIALTHDIRPDDLALGLALRSESFYIGALGSRKTHAARVERLRAANYTDAAIGRIHGPVGLDIGAQTPAEIAVSILAQVIAAKNGRTEGI